MFHLLKIEWLKIKAYRTFWWSMAVTAISYIGVSYAMLGVYHQLSNSTTLPKGAAKMLLGNPFAFSEVWHSVAYFSSLFIVVPALVVIMLISNEYIFKTNRQNVIEGWSRKQFITAKLIGVLLIALLITFTYTFVCLSIGITNTATNEVIGANKMYFIGYFFLQTFSQLSIAFALGFLVRKSFMSIGLFIFIMAMLEPLLTWLFSKNNLAIGHYLPFEISDRMIPPPSFMARMDPKAYELSMNNTAHHLIYTLIFTALLWWVCFIINAKRDL